MKKIFSILALAFSLILLYSFGMKEVKAVNADDYVNLIDVTKLTSTTTGEVCYMDPIPVTRGQRITLVMSKEFFGSKFDEQTLSITGGQSVTVRYLSYAPGDGGYTCAFGLQYKDIGIFIADMEFGAEGTFCLPGLLAYVNDDSEILRNQIMMYYGRKSDFKGFKTSVDLEDFEYYGDGNIQITTSCSNPITTEQIKQNLIAYDSTDGIISSSQIKIIRDEYSGSSNVGIYVIEFQATDSSGNKRNLIVTVSVIDSEPPVIALKGSNQIEINGTTLGLDDLRNYFTITDNYDGVISTDELYGFSWTGSRTYNGQRTGNFGFTVSCDDSSGNTATLTGSFKGIDTTPPTVQLKNTVVNLSEFGTLFNRTVSDYFVVLDDNSKYVQYAYIDAQVNELENSYVGDIPIVVTAIDSSGNQTVKEGVIHIVDDIAPAFYIKGVLLQTTDDNELSTQDLRRKIKNDLKKRNVLFDNLYLIETSYIDNSDKEGTYDIKYMYTYNDQITYETGQIEVFKNEAPLNNSDNKTQASVIDTSKSNTETGTNVQTNVVSNDINPLLIVAMIIPIIMCIIVMIMYKKKTKTAR